jgi:hypothetical protein
MSDEKTLFAQVDACLDTNPKIRKAGSVFATAIFEFLLRRRAIANSNGTIPIRYIDPEYLAGMLMMTCDEARHGTSRAIAAELITIDEANGVVFIVGWSPEWGGRAKTGSERTQSWRERKRAETANHDAVTVVTERHTTSPVTEVTTRDESDVIDKNRIDIESANALEKKQRQRRGQLVPEDWTPAEIQPHERAQLEHFRDHHRAKGTKFLDFEAAWRNWKRLSQKFGTAPQKTFRASAPVDDEPELATALGAR